MDFVPISRCQKLSKKFIIEFKDDISWNCLRKNKYKIDVKKIRAEIVNSEQDKMRGEQYKAREEQKKRDKLENKKLHRQKLCSINSISELEP